MRRYQKLIIIPILIIVASLYLIGVNILSRIDRVDEISDAVPAATESLTEEQEDKALKEIGDKININTATESELRSIDGIGETLAKRIIEKRSELGEYVSIEQLMEVYGIGPSLFEDIRDYVTVE